MLLTLYEEHAEGECQTSQSTPPPKHQTLRARIKEPTPSRGWAAYHQARREAQNIIADIQGRVSVSKTRWVAAITSSHGPADPTMRLVLLAIASTLRGRDAVALRVGDIVAMSALSERTVRSRLQLAARLGWVGVIGSRTRRAYAPTLPAYMRHVSPDRPS